MTKQQADLMAVDDICSFPPGSHAGVVVLHPVSQDPVSVVELVDRPLRATSSKDSAATSRSSNRSRVRVRRPDDQAER